MTVNAATEVLPTVVVGAGLAGLTVAHRLQGAGQSVLVLEKSRGFGGRLSRRRVTDGFAEHGLPLLRASGPLTRELISGARRSGQLQLWSGRGWSLDASGRAVRQEGEDWIAPAGISSLARSLGDGLEVRLQQRLVALEPQPGGWRLTVETPEGPRTLEARRLVLAIPAPQVLELLQPLAQRLPSLLAGLASVRYDPAITAIASYPALPIPDLGSHWRLDCPHHPQLRWLGLDSSKGDRNATPVVVVHSQGDWARARFDASDREALGKDLLRAGAELLALPELRGPTQLQVHRWGYALLRQGVIPDCLAELDLQLWLGGDWCGDRGGDGIEALPHSHLVERALASGRAIAADLLGQPDT